MIRRYAINFRVDGQHGMLFCDSPSEAGARMWASVKLVELYSVREVHLDAVYEMKKDSDPDPHSRRKAKRKI